MAGALTRLSLAQQRADERDALHDEAEEILRRIWEQEPKHPGAIHYSIHATDVDGRAENALDMVEVYADIAPEVPHALHMPSHIYMRLGEWDDATALEPRTPDDLPWDAARWPEAISWYARGLGGVQTGDLDLARDAEQRLAALRERAKDDGDEHLATYIEIDRQILAGWIAHAAGEDQEAVRLMRSAAGLERTVEKHPVTPGSLLPPNETLGDLLMDLDRPTEALEAYQASDEIWPGRYRTLLGAAQAVHAAGDETSARAYYGELLDIASDSGRGGVSEARRYLDRSSRPF